MQDLMLMFATILPEDEIINQIYMSIDTYRADKSKDNLGKIQMYCLLLATKQAVGEKDVFEVSKDMEETRRIRERMHTSKL